MPRPYQPPLSRRHQAVQSAAPPAPPRNRWLWVAVPLLVLGPVVAVVLATEGPFNRPAQETIVTQPGATVTVVAAQPTPTVIVSNPAGPGQSVPTAQATPVVAAQTATTPSAATAPAATNPTSASSTATPASNQVLAAETSTSGPYRVYRVQSGDTIRFVSEMFGVSTASVINASGLSNPDQLRVGQVLTIPLQPGYLYRVRAGETLDQIATRTGLSSESIATASRLSMASVRAGDVILIPDTSAARAK